MLYAACYIGPCCNETWLFHVWCGLPLWHDGMSLSTVVLRMYKGRFLSVMGFSFNHMNVLTFLKCICIFFMKIVILCQRFIRKSRNYKSYYWYLMVISKYLLINLFKISVYNFLVFTNFLLHILRHSCKTILEVECPELEKLSKWRFGWWLCH